MIRYKRRARARMHQLTDVALTPLIDTALTLLVIFMVTAPVMRNSITVDLPKGQVKEGPEAVRKDDIFVTLDKRGQVFIDDEKVTHNFIDIIKKKIGNRTDVVVYVNVDSENRFEAFVKIIDDIKYLTGVEHVVLGTEKAN